MSKKNKIFAIVGVVIIIVAMLIAFYFTTASGKRTIKDFTSDVSGGLERTIEVYDINGKLIKSYSGKFDIDYDSERIKFDDENGKRHVIYYTTGTIIIDEK